MWFRFCTRLVEDLDVFEGVRRFRRFFMFGLRTGVPCVCMDSSNVIIERQRIGPGHESSKR